jgi:hypothetical protein
VFVLGLFVLPRDAKKSSSSFGFDPDDVPPKPSPEISASQPEVDYLDYVGKAKLLTA